MSVDVEKVDTRLPLWELEIVELEGRSLEKRGRDDVNEMLSQGWLLLYMYTLRFKDDDEVWRERPMAILGLPQHPVKRKIKKKEYPEVVIH